MSLLVMAHLESLVDREICLEIYLELALESNLNVAVLQRPDAPAYQAGM